MIAMNIFNKITLKSLQQNRTRTIVTVIGIILSVAMITGVTTFISSLQNFLVQSEIANTGNWHLRYENITLSTIEELNAHSEVASVYVVETVGHGRTDTDSDSGMPFWVEGFSDDALANLPLRLQSGRLPQNYNEIIIPSHMLRDDWSGLGLGDVITLDMESGFKVSFEESATFDEYGAMIVPPLNPDLSRTYTIVGISGWHAYLGSNTLITSASANSAIHTVYIRLNNPRNVFTFDETAGFNVGQDQNQIHARFNVWLLRSLGIAIGARAEAMMLVIYSMGAILIVLIMLGSVSLIYNSFAISVSERAKQFGILSSIGASSKQIRKSVLFEGVFVGMLGIPLGILAGIGGIGVALLVARDVLSEMAPTGVNLTLSISVGAIVVAVLVGILTIFISALIPARKAAKPSAIDTIRQSDDVKIEAKSIKTSLLTRFLFGLEGELAAKNFKRNKKRYRATVVSLIISVVLFISANAFGVYLAMSGERVFIMSEYDVAVFFPMESATVEEIHGLYSHIRDADYVTASNVFFRKFFSAWADTDLLSEEWLDDRFRWGDRDDPIPEEDEIFPQVLFISDESYLEFLRESGFTGGDSSFPAVAQIRHFDGQTNRFVTYDIFRNTSSITLPLYAQRDWERTGNSIPITVSLVNEPPTLILTGGGGISIIAPYSELLRFDFEEYAGLLDGVIAFLSDNPGETTAHIEQLIEGFGFESEHRVINAFAGEEENRRILFLINFFIYGFVALISLITIANVFNTVSTSINLRRREFAMLRSIGMTERGFSHMMNFECLFYGLKALLLGLPLSFGITYLIYMAVISGIDAPFVLPWAGIGIAVFSVFFVVFVTMLYSVRKLRKANVIDVLRTDMA